jgi:4-alpha-glucanotransferase
MDRLRAVLSRVDIVRLDHFRGFAGYWEIPAGAENAVEGQWVDGPGADFFHTVGDTLGELPIIAEDLGEITPDVIELRDQFNLPGMKVLVFAFDSGPDNEFLPHHYTRNYAAYTGTHDNDTARGWFERADQEERDFALDYLDSSGEDIAWDLIRAAWSSVATFAIAPLQDLLGLDNKARMNYPSQPSGNWTWRMAEDALDTSLRNKLRKINGLYGR